MRTGVVEEPAWAAASDHVPIMAEIPVPNASDHVPIKAEVPVSAVGGGVASLALPN